MDGKKRRRDGHCYDGHCGLSEMETNMAEVKLQMKRMQGEIDGMKDRLSRIDDLETQSHSLRNEMASMQTRILRVDKLEHKCRVQERKCRVQESRCRSLEARCNFLARTVQMLVHDDGEWEYSEPVLPSDSVWGSRGFSRHEVLDANNLLNELKRVTFILRSERIFALGDESILLGKQHENDQNHTTMRYGTPLLSHWIEFTDALQVNRQSSVIQQLKMCNMQLPPSVVNMLSAAWQQRSIMSLELDNIHFQNQSEGIDFMVEIINSNQELNDFGLSNIIVRSSEDINYLAKAIINCTSMRNLRLKNCFRTNAAYQVLCGLLAKDTGPLFAVNFGGNYLKTFGGTDMVNFLAANHPVMELNLENNLLNDNDAMAIASALVQNDNLLELNLARNEITEVGRDALRNAIFDSASLNSLADSNHTCRIKGIGFCSDPNNNIVFGDILTNRGRKIYNLLASRNRAQVNVPLLDAEMDEECLKFAPEILWCLNYYHSYCSHDLLANLEHPLSIWYEILRSWLTLFEIRRGPILSD